MAIDHIIAVCADFYRKDEVIAARSLLNTCAPNHRLPKRKGQGMDMIRATVDDIAKLCLDPSIKLPVFYATELARLPPVDITHCDVSAILAELQGLRSEIRHMDIASIVSQVQSLQKEVQMLKTLRSEVDSLRSDIARSLADSHLQSELADLRADVQVLHSEVADLAMNAMGTDMSTAAAAAAVAGMSDSTATGKVNPSFASMANALKGACIVEKTRAAKQTNRPVVGKSTNASQLKSVIMRRPVDIFVSRLSPDTDVSDVKKCVVDILKDDNAKNIDCVQLKPKFTGLYSSFHVSVTVDVREMKHVIEQLNCAELWPDGVLVRRYFRPKD